MFLKKKFFGSGFAGTPPPVDGAYGIFKTTGAGSSRYNYVANTSVAATSLSSSGDRLSSIGNSTLGIFVSGSAGGASDKYVFATGVVTNDAPAPGIAMGSGSTSITQSTFGCVFPNAAGAQPVRKFIFASNTQAPGTSATVAVSGGAGTSSDTTGIVAMGGTAAGGSNITNRYTYADDSIAVGGVLSAALKNGGACGNISQGVFALGGASATTTSNKYTFTADTAVTSTAFVAAMVQLQSTGNSVIGIMNNRGTAITARLTYATDGKVAGTNISAVSVATSNGAVSNGNLGIL